MSKNNPSQRIYFKRDHASVTMLEKFAIEILGAKSMLKDPGLTMHQLSDGTALVFYGQESFDTEDIFKRNNVVLNFRVRDIEAAINYLQSNGALILDGIVRPYPKVAYSHVQLEDGLVIGIYEEK